MAKLFVLLLPVFSLGYLEALPPGDFVKSSTI